MLDTARGGFPECEAAGQNAAAPARITRQDVLAIARSGDAWRAIPYCLQVLRVSPGDEEIGYQAAALLGRLGLRTVALDLLDSLPGLKAVGTVKSLRSAVERLDDDRISEESRREICARNLRCVRIDEGHKREWFAAWSRSAGERECFRTSDGNVVVRPAGGGVTRPWIRFRNDALEAARFALPHLAPEAKRAPAPAYTIEGIDPPFLLARVARETPRMSDGYQALVRVVQRDPMEFLEGLAVMDLEEVLRAERMRYYVGEGAEKRLAEDLSGEFETRFVGPCITLATVRSRCDPSAERVIAQAAGAQAREDAALRSRIGRAYSESGLASLRGVLKDAADGTRPAGGRPLRVLIPTCRYSTYIRHASHDLAEAFRAAGHESRVLMEPDDHSRFSSIAYLRAIDRYRPDFAVLINYTRSQLAGVLPPGLPLVSWYQDSMPHQFSTEVGRSLGANDFVIGHLHAELFTQCGYPDARREHMPMVVSTAKFHEGPVTREQARAYECEIAYVSHHSESPEEMHARLMREAGAGTVAARVFERLYPVVREIALGCRERAAYAELQSAAGSVIDAALLNDPAGRSITQVYRQYCLPLADRIVRHQTLEWAAEMCDRRGWRLHLYGRGWERCARFARFARGELTHDDALRAAYQCAALHLHATIHTPVHQRVMEGAVSGGLVACRLHADAVGRLYGELIDAVLSEAGPDTERTFRQHPGFRVADSSSAMAIVCQLQRLGAALPSPNPAWVYVPAAEAAWRDSPAARLVRESATLGSLLGDVSATTFRDAEELERVAERAVGDGAWRAAQGGMIADRVRRGMTYEVLARRIAGLLSRG
ncbi:MAG: hypothetical protein AB7G11_08775 [Phycisphaerales bacterium]